MMKPISISGPGCLILGGSWYNKIELNFYLFIYLLFFLYIYNSKEAVVHFFNALLSNAPSLNQRVFHQQELEQAGFTAQRVEQVCCICYIYLYTLINHLKDMQQGYSLYITFVVFIVRIKSRVRAGELYLSCGNGNLSNAHWNGNM